MLQTEPRRGAAEGRECGCPPWALMCRHYDSSILTLVDNKAAEPSTHPSKGIFASVLFTVGHGDGMITCRCGCGHAVYHNLSQPSLHYDLPAAEAEFRRREAALLGRAE